MSDRKNNNFHNIYDDKTLENMKRYYRIDTDDELVKYIKRNNLVEPDKGDIMYTQKVKIRNNNNNDSSSRIIIVMT
jgi:hypothetical protein